MKHGVAAVNRYNSSILMYTERVSKLKSSTETVQEILHCRVRKVWDRWGMTQKREVRIEGIDYTVVISDEKEALLAAKRAGRAVIGLQDREGLDLWPASYVAESLKDIDAAYLEQVVRRHAGLPWRIGETRRLLIREFQVEDAGQVPREETDTQEDAVFYTEESLSRYIRCQYSFYEYGLWAVVEKETGRLAGKAGIVRTSYGKEPWEAEAAGNDGKTEGQAGGEREMQTGEDLLYIEIGYHIFHLYRRRGYAAEALRKIVELVKEKARTPVCIYAKIDASNKASIRVAEASGFSVIAQKCIGAGQWLYLCSDCWR